MFLLEGDSKYYDVLERTLYNALLSGISLTADRFFYPNPLESHGEHKRSAWFGCACCPSNICRFIPSVPGYIYAHKNDSLYVNLFMNNQATIALNGEKIEIEQVTQYPWDGKITMKINPAKSGTFSILVRLPGWSRNQVFPTDLYRFKKMGTGKVTIRLNGKNASYSVANGYAVISKTWKQGDLLEVNLPMEVRELTANPAIADDLGKVALQRGPLVYCTEWADNKDAGVLNLLLNKESKYTTKHLPDLLNGITILQTIGKRVEKTGEKGILLKEQSITAIPYYAWANRGPGEMSVWQNIQK